MLVIGLDVNTPVRWLCNSGYPRGSDAKSCAIRLELKSIRNRILIALEVENVIGLCRKGNWIRYQR